MSKDSLPKFYFTSYTNKTSPLLELRPLYAPKKKYTWRRQSGAMTPGQGAIEAVPTGPRGKGVRAVMISWSARCTPECLQIARAPFVVRGGGPLSFPPEGSRPCLPGLPVDAFCGENGSSCRERDEGCGAMFFFYFFYRLRSSVTLMASAAGLTFIAVSGFCRCARWASRLTGVLIFFLYAPELWGDWMRVAAFCANIISSGLGESRFSK